MLAELTFAEIAILLGGTIVGATIAIVLATLSFGRKNTPAGDAPSNSSISFLFDGHNLIDASSGGELLLSGSKTPDDDDWHKLCQTLEPRFGTLPASPGEIFETGGDFRASLAAKNIADNGSLMFRRAGNYTRVSLLDKQLSNAGQQDLVQARRQLDWVQSAINQASDPIWISDKDNTVLWRNDSYNSLAEKLGAQKSGDGEAAAIFATDLIDEAGKPVRIPIQSGPDGNRSWYEVTTRPHQVGVVCYARNIDAVVKAEVAQRNFVQTLTKTFAQLSIGLAIFDRNQQLALFNPALIDLTMLPADFLSARPDLLSFFDHLREERIMPEPKSYASWREQMADLVAAAQDGRYCETWNLPSGLTYRVSGKPHPDGAIAFLIEDISAEISLTRRFRADLELSHAVLDRQTSALAVFSQLGVLAFSNEAYRMLWQCDPDSSFAETTIADCVKLWQSQSQSETLLESLPGYVAGLGQRAQLDGKLVHEKHGQVNVRAEALPGGATLIKFARSTQPAETNAPSENRSQHL